MDRRVNITMAARLLEEVDAIAGRTHLTRSGLIREALKSYLDNGTRPSPHPSTLGSPAVGSPTPYDPGVTSSPAPPPDSNVLADRLRAFCAGQDDIVAAYLFGSAATGRAGPLSDVDVAVLLDQSSDRRVGDAGSAPRQSDLASRMPKALGVSRVDVVILNTAPIALAFHAISSGRVVVGSAHPARVRFEVRLLHEHTDLLPQEREYTTALRKRIAEGFLSAR